MRVEDYEGDPQSLWSTTWTEEYSDAEERINSFSFRPYPHLIFESFYVADIEPTINRALREQGEKIRRLATEVTKKKHKIASLKKENVCLRNNLARPKVAKTTERTISPLLEELIQLGEVKQGGRRYSPQLLEYAFCIATCSWQAYKILRALLPFPSRSTLYTHFRPSLKKIEASLISSPPDPTQLIADQIGCLRSEITDEPLLAILAVDAAAFTPFLSVSDDTVLSNCFVFQLQILRPDFPVVPISVILRKNGFGDTNIIERMADLRRILLGLDITVLATAVDGDTGYNRCYTDLYDVLSKRGSLQTLELTPDDFFNHDFFMCDLFHFLKCARSHLLAFRLVVDFDQPGFSAEDLIPILGATPSLTDISPMARLKDDVATDLFTIDNLLKLFVEKRYDAVMFFLPLVCWNTALRQGNLTLSQRIELINTALACTDRLLSRQMKKERELKTKKRVIFSRLELVKLSLTLAATKYALKATNGYIALDRLGTYPVENLFGYVRVATRADFRYTMFISAISRGMMLRMLIRKYGFKSPIKRFQNSAGVKLIPDSYPELRADYSLEQDEIGQLLVAAETGLLEGAPSYIVFFWAVQDTPEEKSHALTKGQCTGSAILSRYHIFRLN